MQNLIILNIKDYSGSLEKGFLLILFQLFLRWLCADYNYCKYKYTSHTKLDSLAASLWALHIDAVTFYIPTQVHWESIPLSRGFSFSSVPLRIKWAGMSHTNHILKSISRPIKLQITGKHYPPQIPSQSWKYNTALSIFGLCSSVHVKGRVLSPGCSKKSNLYTEIL